MSELSRVANPVGKQGETEKADEQEEADELQFCCYPWSPFACASNPLSLRTSRC